MPHANDKESLIMMTPRFVALFISMSLIPLVLAADRPPNIVVIMADDLGYADVEFQGCKDIRTPNIDKLAQGGARFTQGYVTGCMCGPSRAGFITGRVQSTFGYYINVSEPLDPKQGFAPGTRTVAHKMQTQGYVTGLVGKWHMGTAEHQHPDAMGFDDWYGFLGGGLMYYPLDHPSYKDKYREKTKPWNARDMQHTLPMLHNGKQVDWDQYLTRELTDGSIRFIKKNRDKPFFLFVSYNAPHEYLEAPEETIAKYPPDAMTQVPGVPAKSRSVYAAMVDEMDQGIGELMETIDELKLADNTVVWFLSDHGGLKRTSDNRPLRGAKGDSYEGGLRVPFVVCWPGHVKPGTVLNHPVTALDIGATSVELAGGDAGQAGLHGENLADYITGQSSEKVHDAIYWHTGTGPHDHTGALRDGDYKLVLNRGEAELFNIKSDPAESNNLVADQPQRVDQMMADWRAWNKANNKPPLWRKSKKNRDHYQYADYDWLKGTVHESQDDK